MKKILGILALSATTVVFAQNVKLKKGIIRVDDKEWAKYEGCGFLDNECSFFLGDNEVAITRNTNRDIKLVSKENTSGTEGWDEVKFLGTNKSFETKEDKNIIAKALYKAKVLNDDGTLNEQAIDRLVEKYGRNFTEKYRNMPSTNQVIIVK